MTSPKGPSDPLVEDGAAAYRKFEEFTRRILTVPKKLIDRKLAQEKLKRRKRAK